MTPRLVERGIVLGLGLAATHVALVPVGHEADRLAMPDLLFCLLAAFAVRRPEAAPLTVVLALGLLADLLLARPPGLGALGLVLASEALRQRRAGGFVGEWLAVALIFAAILAATALLLALTLAAGPGAAALGAHWLATVIAYPFVAALVRGLTRQRRGAR